jgi:hypothetical protein
MTKTFSYNLVVLVRDKSLPPIPPTPSLALLSFSFPHCFSLSFYFHSSTSLALWSPLSPCSSCVFFCLRRQRCVQCGLPIPHQPTAGPPVIAHVNLSAVCCLLSAVCCLLSAVCCLLSAVCCLLSYTAEGLLRGLRLSVFISLLPRMHNSRKVTNPLHGRRSPSPSAASTTSSPASSPPRHHADSTGSNTHVFMLT